MADKNQRKDEQNDEVVENRTDDTRIGNGDDNPNQAGEQGERIASHEIGEESDLTPEERERQQAWREDPDSREYFGPKVVPADDVSPKS